MIFNFLDYNAVGDGQTLNTRAFAEAIKAAANGGHQAHSVIVVPPGIYRTGSITLQSNMTLRVEAGARILGSRNLDDYEEIAEIHQRRVENPEKKKILYLARYLISAQNAVNVIIEGDGEIDGSGDAFWSAEETTDGQPWQDNDSRWPVYYHVMVPHVERPAMLVFWKCSNVNLRGIRILNSPSYTVWPQGCEQVRISGITIRNPLQGPNTDALDIDCCSHVLVNNCDIIAGDDCIALKSDTARLGEARPCQYICVSDCILSSMANGVRLGFEGDGPIRDCTFSNLVIHDAFHAIDMLSVTSVSRPDFRTGTPIERIVFSNVVTQNVASLFFIWSGSEQAERPCLAQIRHLTFSNIDADVRKGSFLGAVEGLPVSDVTFSNVRISMRHHSYFDGKPAGKIPCCWGHENLTDVVWFENARNIRMENVQLESDRPGGKTLHWRNVEGLAQDGRFLPVNGDS